MGEGSTSMLCDAGDNHVQEKMLDYGDSAGITPGPPRTTPAVPPRLDRRGDSGGSAQPEADSSEGTTLEGRAARGRRGPAALALLRRGAPSRSRAGRPRGHPPGLPGGPGTPRGRPRPTGRSRGARCRSRAGRPPARRRHPPGRPAVTRGWLLRQGPRRGGRCRSPAGRSPARPQHPPARRAAPQG